MVMPLRKSDWRGSLKELALILALGVLNGILFCPTCWNDPILMRDIILSSCFIWLIMWKGNSYASKIIDHFYSWLHDPVKRLIYGVLAHVVYTALATIAIVYALELIFSIQFAKVWVTTLISIGIALFISLVLHSREFLIAWRKLAIESEKMKKEAITSKYETLKNQVNPHFLFNSLNALTNLVYEDQDLAARFIKKLSDVYRYVLETKDKELVSLQTEMDFVQDYIFLQKIRFGDNLIIMLDLQEKSNLFIVPLSLQMLVENAIKHNEISDEYPLVISFNQKDDYLVLSSTLRKKNIIREGPERVGLSNIKSRYSFLTDREVMIEQTASEFIVKIPLLNHNPWHEGTDH